MELGKLKSVYEDIVSVKTRYFCPLTNMTILDYLLVVLAEEINEIVLANSVTQRILELSDFYGAYTMILKHVSINLMKPTPVDSNFIFKGASLSHYICAYLRQRPDHSLQDLLLYAREYIGCVMTDTFRDKRGYDFYTMLVLLQCASGVKMMTRDRVFAPEIWSIYCRLGIVKILTEFVNYALCIDKCLKFTTFNEYLNIMIKRGEKSW